MNFDFALLLTALTGLAGLIWLVDELAFAPKRKKHNAVLQEGQTLLREPMITEQAKSFLPVLAIVLVVRSFWFEPFKIPSGSMMPTLLVGDFIVVNKYAYGIRLPVLNTKIIEFGKPERGEVIVFRRPRDINKRPGEIDDQEGVNYIKRCVGLPGDRVRYSNHMLYVNDQLVEAQPISEYVSEGASQARTGTMIYSIDIAKDSHQGLYGPFSAPGTEGEWVVPEGHYFMMGDNRDDSLDSRSWGTVPEENLVGRASLIWFHFDSKRKGIVAWSRIGNSVK